MQQPENQSRKYDRLFADIDCGRIKIPKFQRDFVWTTVKTASLIDSIIKGYPIGTFIFWKTREEMRHYKNIGYINLPDIPKGDAALYVLDGQQRITSLYAVRKGIRFTKEGEELDYKRISVNLALDPDTDDPVVTVEPPQNVRSITVYNLLNGSIADLAREYESDELLRKIDIYRSRLTGYDFSTIDITDYPVEIACEVFSRINTGGTALEPFEIMVARMFDPSRDFDLADEYEKLKDSNNREKDLEDAGFETVPGSTVLQCVAAHLCGQVRTKDILKLKKADFIDAWPTVKKGLFAAVDFVRTQLRIPASKLLPYDALLVPFTYFFIRNQEVVPSGLQTKLLVQYFWWASLSNRFTSSADTKLGQDLERMDSILREEPPAYIGDDALQVTLDQIRWKWFSTGDAFCKAILCLYAYFEPKCFDSNRIVTLDNSNLQNATSRNYHHFFPRAYLSKGRIANDTEANSVLNITLVDDYLNKRKIKAQAPSVYMKEFQEQNEELDKTMRTHLIDDMDDYGIWKDDYFGFIEHRGKRVLEEIEKRLNPNL